MRRRRAIGLLSMALWGASWIAPGTLHAASEEFSLEALKLQSAGDLVNVCTLGPDNEHYETALAFCYGFFEGAIRYAEAISGTPNHHALVCAPPGTTRLQAVEVFVAFMDENAQYYDEGPVDAIYRALIPRWPCTD